MKRTRKNPLGPIWKAIRPKKERWEVFGLDVWGCSLKEWLEEEGNTEDDYEGYTVNNWWSEGHICLPDGPTDQEVLDEMIASGFIRKGTTLSDIQFDDCGDTFTIEDADTGEPIYNVERREDEDDECGNGDDDDE